MFSLMIDDWDWLRLCKYKWRVKKCRSQRYIARDTYKNGIHLTVYMHRVIMKTPEGMECHHKNRNTFDNQTENLENLTKQGHKKKDRERIETNNKQSI